MTDDDKWAHTMLARALGAEPELGIDPDAVLTRARRDRTQRWAALTGGITVFALVATALLLHHGERSELAKPPAHLTTSTPATTTAPSVTVSDSEGMYVLDQHGRELTAILADAHLIPSNVAVSSNERYDVQPLVFYRLIDGQFVNTYYTQATLTDAHGAGHLFVQVLRAPTGLTCAGTPSSWGCTSTVRPDGSRLTSMLYQPDPGSGGGKQSKQWNVELIRPDGTAVNVLCGNWRMDGTGGAPTGAAPPLSMATVVKLAELPGLTP